MVHPPTGEQAEQPSNGREQLPNNPPQSSDGPPPPVKRANIFAIAGVILAVFVLVLGLTFSIIGFVKFKTLADASKAFSGAGIVVSPPVGAVPGTGGNVIAIGAGSITVDPGCVTAGSVGKQMTNMLNADKAAISQDQNNPSAQLTDLQHLVTDLQSLQRQMTTAEAKATHQSVKAGISAMIGDLNTFSSSLQALGDGDLSQVNQMATIADNVKSDGRTIAATCTSVSLTGPKR